MNENKMDTIEAWIYINLDHRTDRNQQILDVLQNDLKVAPEKIVRISAVYTPQYGLYGCAQSHVLALRKAMKYKRACILEDDFVLCDTASRFKAVVDTIPDGCSVFLPSMGLGNRQTKLYDDQFCQVLRSQTTSSYILWDMSVAQSILDIFQESVDMIRDSNFTIGPSISALDQRWTQLQPKTVWLSVLPPLGQQRESYSDIEKRNVNYGC